ncbi:MAG: hypothetical protein Q9191_001841, partial [Dirinaria sp. TL-2023a]
MYAEQENLQREIEGLKEGRERMLEGKVLAVSETEVLRERNEILELLCRSLEERDAGKRSDKAEERK